MTKVLMYAKDEGQITANGNIFTTDYTKFHPIDVHSKPVESVELEVMSKVFLKRGWVCSWTCLDWLNLKEQTIKFYTPVSKTEEIINLTNLSDDFDVIIFRIIGSVEGRKDLVERIDVLQNNFTGIIINHPETMKYGIRKDYILELQKEGFPVPKTSYFENSVKLKEILEVIAEPANYIIKPITGELSNSLAILSEINEDFLRRKESKVGGWLVQPLIEDIRNGEYQLIFFGELLSHGLKKTYSMDRGMRLPSQDQNHREISLYNPSEQEIELALSIYSYFQTKLKRPVYSFRFDYLKMANEDIKILEFEILNPGFFIGYLKDDDAKFAIALKFANAITKLLGRDNR